MATYAQRVAEFGTTIFTEINNLAAQHHATNLGQGRPDFDGPPQVIAEVVKALQTGQHNQYAPGIGVPEFREAIASHAGRFYGLEVDPANVISTCGATQALYAAVMGLVDVGDEVIVFEPFYDSYVPNILMAGATPVYVPLHPPEWVFDPDELRAAFSDRTRALIINTPNNPTGRVFTVEELTQIAELCQEFDVTVIADEVYEHLTFDGARHVPIASLPGMDERTVSISSVGKTFNVTGWKVGWAYGPPELMTGLWRAHQFITFGVFHPAQLAVAYALNQSDSYYTDYQASYLAKRGILLDALTQAGLKPRVPEGTFFVMADFSDVFDGNDVEFARFLTAEIGVACIPPTAFYSAPHKSIVEKQARFAFCKTEATLYEAAEKLKKLEKLKDSTQRR